MPLRRIFLLGAATIVSFAALVAIAAILSGGFDQTDAKIFGTLATAFVAGATAVAGIACLDRGVARAAGIFGVVVASVGFVLWTEEIWAEHGSSSYWKVLGLVLIWTIAALMVTTTRLMARSQQVAGTLFIATGATTTVGALVVSTMVLRESGDGWQLFAVLLILAVLGEILTPIVQRYVVTPADEVRPRERVLGEVGGSVVVAVRTDTARRLIRIGEREVPFEDDEMIIVRPA